MTCKDCIHYDACSAKGGLFNEKDESKEMLCNHFKNKADYVEVVRCKDCKYFSCNTPNDKYCMFGNALSVSNDNSYCSYGQKK